YTISFSNLFPLIADPATIGSSTGATATIATVTNAVPTAAQVQANLRTISALNNNVFVSGQAPTYTVTFGGSLAGQTVLAIASDTAGTMTAGSTVQGSAPTAAQIQANLQTIPALSGNGNEVQQLTLVANGTTTLSF